MSDHTMIQGLLDSAVPGETLTLEADYELAEGIVVPTGIGLAGSGSLTAVASMATMIALADTGVDQSVRDLTINCGGLCQMAISGRGNQYPVISGLEITGWRAAIGLGATATVPQVSPQIEGNNLHDPAQDAGLPFPVNVGGWSWGLGPWCLFPVIHGNTITGSGSWHGPGGTGTADLIAVHASIGGRISNNVLRDGGENGITISRSCRGLSCIGNDVQTSDGYGIQIGASAVTLVVNNIWPAVASAQVVGQVSGATGQVSATSAATGHLFHAIDGVSWLTRPGRSFMAEPTNTPWKDGEVISINGTNTVLRAALITEADFVGNTAINNGQDRGNQASGLADVFHYMSRGRVAGNVVGSYKSVHAQPAYL